jgi:hypothetical protein
MVRKATGISYREWAMKKKKEEEEEEEKKKEEKSTKIFLYMA